MNSCPEYLDNFRYIVCSARSSFPLFPFDSNNKRRKTDQREANQTTHEKSYVVAAVQLC